MSDTPPQAPEPRSPSALTGVAWLLAFRVVDRLAGIVSFLVLARLLLPEHFGVVALATAVIAFIEILTSLGLDTILIQIRQLTRSHYDTAWTIQIGMAVFCAALIAAAAYPASVFFREPRLFPVLCVLALSFVIEGLQNIKMVDFRREMRFDKEFVFLASRRLVTICVTIGAALVLRNEWALAIGMLVSRTAGTALSYMMRPYRPRFTLALKREFLTKSSWLLLSGIVMFLRQRSSDFALGRMRGAASVGAFTLASDLATMVTMELAVPINRVALSDLSAQRTREDLVARFDAVTGLVAVMLAPLGFGLAACAQVAVLVLFGPAWVSAGDVLRILAIASLISAMVSNLGVPIMALGHYRYNFVIHAVGAAVLVPLLIAGVYYHGPVGAAMAMLIANAVTAATAMILAGRVMDYGLWRFLLCVWRPVLAAILMYAVVVWTAAQIDSIAPQLPSALLLAIVVCAGALVYPLALGLLWLLCGRPDGAERTAMSLLRKVLQRVPGLASHIP
jgi:lipopolysaccharide exporter